MTASTLALHRALIRAAHAALAAWERWLAEHAGAPPPK